MYTGSPRLSFNVLPEFDVHCGRARGQLQGCPGACGVVLAIGDVVSCVENDSLARRGLICFLIVSVDVFVSPAHIWRARIQGDAFAALECRQIIGGHCTRQSQPSQELCKRLLVFLAHDLCQLVHLEAIGQRGARLRPWLGMGRRDLGTRMTSGEGADEASRAQTATPPWIGGSWYMSPSNTTCRPPNRVWSPMPKMSFKARFICCICRVLMRETSSKNNVPTYCHSARCSWMAFAPGPRIWVRDLQPQRAVHGHAAHIACGVAGHGHDDGFRSFWPAVLKSVIRHVRRGLEQHSQQCGLADSRAAGDEQPHGLSAVVAPILQAVVVHFALFMVQRTHVPPMLLISHKVRQCRGRGHVASCGGVRRRAPWVAGANHQTHALPRRPARGHHRHRLGEDVPQCFVLAGQPSASPTAPFFLALPSRHNRVPGCTARRARKIGGASG